MRSFRVQALALLAAVLSAAAAFCAPPAISVPEKVSGEAGAFVVVRATTDGKSVRFVALDKGLQVFPAELLSDKKATVVVGSKGVYRLLAYTGNEDGPSEPAITTITLGGATAPVDPPTPPVDPPVPTPTALFFLVVRADGPASPAFTKAMADPAWGELRVKGHSVKDYTITAALTLGAYLPAGQTLPCVVVLQVSADGKTSMQLGDARPFPTTPDAIGRLPEGR